MATGSATVTTANAILKTQWPQKRVQELFYQQCPVLGLMKPINDFTGDGTIKIAVQHGGQQGVASTLSNAQSNQSSNLFKAFSVTRSDLYGSGKISGVLMRSSKDDRGSLVRAYDREMKSLMNSMKRRVSMLLWGLGGGSMGQIGSISGSTITLLDVNDSVWFDVDQQVFLSANDGTGAHTLRAGGPLVVSNVNRGTGVITFTAGVVATIGAAVANDYIFLQGIFNPTTAVLQGIRSWVPTTDPTSTAFFGVDRSVDVTRLGGLRHTADAGGPIEVTIQNALGLAKREGASPDVVVLNPMDMAKLISSLDSKRAAYTRSERKAMAADVGYNAVKIWSPVGEIDVIADEGVATNKAWALQMDTWELHTLGELPMYIEEDGLMIRAAATADEYEWRLFAGGNVVCTAPGWNMYIAL